MAKSQDDLIAFLHGVGIESRCVGHPPLHTVEESRSLRGEIAGAHTKNLFVKDRKDRYFLMTVPEDGIVDLKTIHTIIGASGKVSFGSSEALMELLGVAPGAVTLFGALNDGQARVKFCIDEQLMAADIVNAHPLTNEATLSIASRDLPRFMAAAGHDLHVLKLSA